MDVLQLINVLVADSVSGQNSRRQKAFVPPHIHQPPLGHCPQNTGSLDPRVHFVQHLLLHRQHGDILQVRTTVEAGRTGGFGAGTHRSRQSRLLDQKMIRPFSQRLTSLSASWQGIFLLGFAGGAAFELFKIYFSFNGVNYYSVFKKKQMQKELDAFEKNLKDLDQIIVTGRPQTFKN